MQTSSKELSKLGIIGAVMAFAVGLQAATLTTKGKPSSVIVVPDQESRIAREAAELLQSMLAKMTGATIPIQTEAKVNGVPSPGHAWLSVGNTRFAQSKGFKSEALKPEEIRLHITATYAIVAGNDAMAGDSGRENQRGTYFAALELLERLGVRWLWPGETGEVIPKKATVSVGPLEYAFAPPLLQRHMRFNASHGGPGLAKFGVDMQKAGLDGGDWPEHMRLGGSRRVGAGHNFGDWYDKYFKTHPEYFAVGEDGKTFGWMGNTERSKLCVSNPGVLEQVVKEAKQYYKSAANPEGTCFSLSPTDSQSGHCMCVNCRKMDALDGPKESWPFVTADGQRTIVNHVSLTDRYVTFWNRVASRLETECPYLLLTGNAYGVYRTPPLHVEAHRNIVVSYVGDDYTNEALRRSALQQWDAWAARANRIMFRPNLMREGRGFPLLWPIRMGDDIKHFAHTGLVATDIANILGHWGTQGLNYYVLAKMMWNPEQDPRAVVDDYCTTGFGPAAPAIKKYFAKLIQLTDQLAAYSGEQGRDAQTALAQGEEDEELRNKKEKIDLINPAGWERFYTPTTMKQLESYLSEAKRLSAVQPAIRRRVELLSLGFEYARLDLKMKEAIYHYENDRKSKEKTIELLQAAVGVDQWSTKHANNLAVGVAVGYYNFSQQLLGTPAGRYAQAVIPEKLPDGSCRLKTLAYSRDKRITKMQLSLDGKQWAEPRPYAPTTIWHGSGKVFVRFYLEGSKGPEWSKPVEAEL